jgi:hypothetical protein
MYKKGDNKRVSIKLSKYIFVTKNVWCAVYFCALFLSLFKDKHCRSPPTYSFQKMK